MDGKTSKLKPHAQALGYRTIHVLETLIMKLYHRTMCCMGECVCVVCVVCGKRVLVGKISPNRTQY